jgi:hypothetical protein
MDDTVTLPLWAPSNIKLGAVGYLEKPRGAFITLFNSFNPTKASEGAITGLPSLYGYGRITRGEQRQDKRGAARRGLDALAGLLQFKSYSYVAKICPLNVFELMDDRTVKASADGTHSSCVTDTRRPTCALKRPSIAI